jgi:hypothetical protein
VRRRGFTRLSGKRQITPAVEHHEELGVAPGDELRVTAADGRIVLSREEGPVERRRRAIREVVREHARRVRGQLSRQAARRVALSVFDASVLIALHDAATTAVAPLARAYALDLPTVNHASKQGLRYSGE